MKLRPKNPNFSAANAGEFIATLFSFYLFFFFTIVKILTYSIEILYNIL
nr:MAG TPA: TRL10 protein [Caudoviricetes sp.]